MIDVVALGELLIDFTPENSPGENKILFSQNPGGAPANLLCSLARLGRSTSFIGKVGNDQFGHYLEKVLVENGVDPSGLVFSATEKTTLAFVHLDKAGDRSFSFVRNPGADQKLTAEEVNLGLIEQAKVFHFGSLSMTHEPARSAALQTVRYAKEKGCLISFDPNLREPLWDHLEQAKEFILAGAMFADVLKLSDEEFHFLTGTDDFEEGTKYFLEQGKKRLILITLGKQGCFYRMGTKTGIVPGIQVETMDTTGAGDAFLGGILYRLTEEGISLETINQFEMEEIIRFANITGALATTKKGAIPAMPSLQEINQLF
jgi:fructokinase